MSEPTPPVVSLTPEELERWAVATILETVRWPQLREGLQARIKLEGTRALRGMPFTFCCRIEKGSDAKVIIFHGMIAGVSLVASTKRGANERAILLLSDLIAGNGDLASIACCVTDPERSGWFLSDGNDLDDREATGTLEIG
ncbi:MAG: hypothetical protein Q7S02_06250 [bacterium]|nr:hypothetical protein [bacterium]